MGDMEVVVLPDAPGKGERHALVAWKIVDQGPRECGGAADSPEDGLGVAVGDAYVLTREGRRQRNRRRGQEDLDPGITLSHHVDRLQQIVQASLVRKDLELPAIDVGQQEFVLGDVVDVEARGAVSPSFYQAWRHHKTR